MKIIFLDVDGVLCTSRSHLGSGFDESDRCRVWDKYCVAFLRQILTRDRSIRLVITSTWRQGCSFSLDWFEEYNRGNALHDALTKHGLMDFLHTHWRTREISHIQRNIEIKRWLEEYGRGIEDYIIIDDFNYFDEDQYPHFLQTNAANGLSVEDYCAILARWFKEYKSTQDDSKTKIKFGTLVRQEALYTQYYDE